MTSAWKVRAVNKKPTPNLSCRSFSSKVGARTHEAGGASVTLADGCTLSATARAGVERRVRQIGERLGDVQHRQMHQADHQQGNEDGGDDPLPVEARRRRAKWRSATRWLALPLPSPSAVGTSTRSSLTASGAAFGRVTFGVREGGAATAAPPR